MKKIKLCQFLCLLFAAICFILAMTTCTVFAAHTDGGTEVIAHIEPASTSPVQPATENTVIPDSNDPTNILTGNILSGCIIVLIILIIAVLVIYLFSRSNNNAQL